VDVLVIQGLILIAALLVSDIILIQVFLALRSRVDVLVIQGLILIAVLSVSQMILIQVILVASTVSVMPLILVKGAVLISLKTGLLGLF
jgi:hypothetical protein